MSYEVEITETALKQYRKMNNPFDKHFKKFIGKVNTEIKILN